MKLRVGVAVVALLVIGLGLSLLTRLSSTPPAGDTSSRIGTAWNLAYTDSDTWQRENSYLEQANSTRLSSGDNDGELLPEGDIPHGAGSIRVLVLGDSFVWGSSVIDPDMRWWVKLQDILDARTTPGAFTVRAVGTPGAGTLLQSTWLRGGILETYDPDVIVSSYVTNDPIPHPADFAPGGGCATQCPPLLNHQPEFIECYKKERSERLCYDQLHPQFPTAVLYADAIAEPPGGPYSDTFRNAISDIADASGERALLWMPTPTDPADWDSAQAVEPLFSQAGFTTITPRATIDTLRPLPPGANADPDRHLNPEDAHPGPVLTTAYATDVADAILSNLPPATIHAAEAAAEANPPAASSLITWTLPTDTTITETPTDTTVQFTSTQEIPAGQQGAPCASLKRPHARVVLSRLLPPGEKLELSLKAGPRSGIAVYTFGYHLDGTTHAAPLGTLDVGQTITLTSGPLARGLLLAAPGPEGCPASPAPALPGFTIALSPAR